MFSEKVYNALVNAGWVSCRKLDIRNFEQALLEDAYEVWPLLKDFLSEFGGLVLVQPSLVEPTVEEQKKYPKLSREMKLHFVPADADSVKDSYEARAGERLTPFGAAYNDHLTLMMTPTGKIYGGYDNFLCFMGNSYVEMLENIYHRIKTPEIP